MADRRAELEKKRQQLEELRARRSAVARGGQVGCLSLGRSLSFHSNSFHSPSHSLRLMLQYKRILWLHCRLTAGG